jgi:hypothetical protein
MFAWWPWKQSPSIPYQHVASAASRGSAPETSLWRTEDETVPQAGTSPRRLPLDTRPDLSGRSETADRSPRSAAASSSAASPERPAHLARDVPSPLTSQQRLEFLRYLVQRGIVNEGIEDDHPG